MDKKPADACKVCQKTADEVALNKCPICFKYYCDDDRFLLSGREFCGKFCAEYFFFSEEDE